MATGADAAASITDRVTEAMGAIVASGAVRALDAATACAAAAAVTTAATSNEKATTSNSAKVVVTATDAEGSEVAEDRVTRRL